MKGWLSALMFLLVVLAVVEARAQETDSGVSLGDVARQNRPAAKADPKFVLTDQIEEDPGPAQTLENSICGAPIPLMQTVYASTLVGQKTPSEEEVAKELVGWLDKHPDIEKMDPEDLAKSYEPRTESQSKANKELAEKIAQSFTDEMVEYKPLHSDDEVKERVAQLMSGKLPQRQADVLESAVRDEKRRRAEAEVKTPSDKDRLEEAVNLYAICENKRLIASQGEVEKLTKAALKAKLEQVGFVVAEGQ
jgi:hypothetical protein